MSHGSSRNTKLPHLFAFWLTLILASTVSVCAAWATTGITYQGRILKPDGSPVSGANVQFRLQIRTPGSQNCLMYEEQQSINMSSSNGNFSLTINDGSGVRSDATGFGLDRIFSNRVPFSFDSTTCSIGSVFSPSPDDGRKLLVYFKDETMSSWEPMPVQNINFVPHAIQSMNVGGYAPENLLRFAESDGSLVNTSPLNNAQYTELLALVNGTSTAFEKAGKLGGVSLPTLGAGQAGQVLSWSGTGWTTTDTVGNNAVTTVKIQDSAVTSSKIADGTIVGSDLATNISITTTGAISSNGTISSNVSSTRDVRLFDADAAPNENYISLKAPASLTANYNYVWPANYGTASQVLTTDGTGGLTWAAPAVSSQWVDGAAGAISYSGGNVGIGTATPATKLNVVDANNVDIKARITAAGASNNASVSATNDLSHSVFIASNSSASSSWGAYQPDGAVLGAEGSGGLSIASQDASSGSIKFHTGGGGPGKERVRIDASGRIGIGVTSPTSRLHLPAGTATANTAPLKFSTGTLLTTPEDGAMEYNSASGLYFTIGSTRYIIPTNTAAGNYSNVNTISNSGGSITMTSAAGNSVIVSQSTVSTSSTTGALVVNGGVGVAGALNSAGNITSGGSITATNAVYSPQIYGSNAASGNIKIDGTSDATAGNVLLATAGGKVGIGTTAPATVLDVVGTTRVGSQSALNDSVHTGLSIGQMGAQGGLEINGGRGAGSLISSYLRFLNSATNIAEINVWTGTNATSGVIAFNTAATGASAERMRIDQTGNVGIGTTSPAFSLDVNGPVNAGAAGYNIASANALSGNSSVLNVNGTAANRAVAIFPGSSAASPALYVANPSGNVGIGTTSPASPLSVTGDIRTTTGMIISGYGSFGYSGGALNLLAGGTTNVTLGAGSAERIRITASNGYVGIGTTAPASELDVKGTLRLSGSTSGYVGLQPAAAAGSTTYTLPAADGTSGQVLSTNGAGLLSWATASGGGGTPGGANTQIQFNSSGAFAGSSNLIWDNTNNRLGINTASPSAALSVEQGNTAGIIGGRAYMGGWSGGTTEGVFANADMYGWNTSNFALRQSNGGRTVLNSASGNELQFAIGNTEQMRLALDGNFGIGTTNPTTKLAVAGVIAPSADNSYTLGTSALRFSTIYAANATVNTSDRRLKTNIKDSDLGLDFVRSLRPISYNWKVGDKDLHYGLIAQEAEEAIQAAHLSNGREPANTIVDHDPKTDRYGVRYTELIAPMIKAIQELFAKLTGVESDVASMKADLASKTDEIQKLKSENAEMKARLDRIEKALAK